MRAHMQMRMRRTNCTINYLLIYLTLPRGTYATTGEIQQHFFSLSFKLFLFFLLSVCVKFSSDFT